MLKIKPEKAAIVVVVVVVVLLLLLLLVLLLLSAPTVGAATLNVIVEVYSLLVSDY